MERASATVACAFCGGEFKARGLATHQRWCTSKQDGKRAEGPTGQGDAVTCRLCGNKFKARGLKRHQQACSNKKARREGPTYKFMVGDGRVFEHVLSFLGHQSLTKLQAITGDHYKMCEPDLARICCACENDRPAIFNGRCSTCATEEGYKPLITTTEAKTQYGLKDLRGVPCDVRRRYTLYARTDLDRHVLRVFGSQAAWVRSLAEKEAKARKRSATKQKKIDEFNALLRACSEPFRVYVNALQIKVKASEIQQCYRRFTELTEALRERDLELRRDSRLCGQYIASGTGQVVEIVDTMEEMKFLFAHTDYSTRCRGKIQYFQESNREMGVWLPREDYNDFIADIRLDVKIKLCIEYLGDAKGLELPRKWEHCRERYDALKAAGRKPTKKASKNYIYHGVGRPPQNYFRTACFLEASSQAASIQRAREHTHHSTKTRQRRSLTRIHRASEESPTVVCSLCNRVFDARGLKHHQQKCKSKKARPEGPTYKFMIGDTLVFEHILSFLRQQSLTKLQAITGDRYKVCDPNLARICCACENDMPGIFDGRCTECTTAKGYNLLINKSNAKLLYGFKDLSGVPCEEHPKHKLYARANLDNHVLREFGSQSACVKRLADRDTRARKREAVWRKEYDNFNAMLGKYPEAFRVFMKDHNRVRWQLEISGIHSASQRFLELTAALEKRGLQLLKEETEIFEDYVATGVYCVSTVVDTMEELRFVIDHTDYRLRCCRKLGLLRANNRQIGITNPHHTPDHWLEEIRSDIKKRLRIDYLANGKGLELPAKWECCRDRFDAIKTAGKHPSQDDSMRYIYYGGSWPQGSSMKRYGFKSYS